MRWHNKQGQTDTGIGRLGGVKSQSEIIGVILIVAITVLTITIIFATGMPSINSAKSSAAMERTVNEFSLLDKKASEIGLGRVQSENIRLNTERGSLHIDQNAGWVNLTYYNFTSTRSGNLFNRSLGAVTYKQDGEKVGYQGGGVWRKKDDSTVMVSAPEFSQRENTLNFPLIRMRGGGGSSGSAESNTLTINQVASAREIFPDRSDGRTNPLDQGVVYVELKSEFCEGWENYFKEDTNVVVVSECKNGIVKARLGVPPTPITVEEALVSANALQITVNNQAVVDSYNSSQGPYSSTQSNNGEISAAGQVVVENGGEVYGNIYTSDTGSKAIKVIDSKSRLYGDAHASGGIYEQKSDNIQGDKYPNESVNTANYAVNKNDNLVNNLAKHYKTGNDNADASCISGKDIVGSCTITAGDYYLGNTVVSKHNGNTEDLTLDTSSGSVSIVVNGTFELAKGAKIDVVGDGRVYLYVKNDVYIHNRDSNITTDPSQTAAKFTLRVASRGDVDIVDNLKFEGIVYAPGSQIRVRDQAEVYGAVVGNYADISNRGKVHFDESIADTKRIVGKNEIVYLYASENIIKIEKD